MSIVFVNSKQAIQSNRGSWKIRGISTSNLFQGHTLSCQDDIFKFLNRFPPIIAMVHVKNPCYKFVNFSLYNIYDAVDNKKYVNLSRFDAQITANIHDSCTTKICMRIPHHDNLHCNVHKLPISHHTPTIGIVGNEQSISYLKSYRIIRETDFSNSCAFFNSIDIAIAWKKRALKSELPCERFTNPVSWNIPTIGYPYKSYKSYNHSNTFICSDLKCIFRKIRDIRTGVLEYDFNQLRNEVVQDIGPTHIKHLYNLLFEKLKKY